MQKQSMQPASWDGKPFWEDGREGWREGLRERRNITGEGGVGNGNWKEVGRKKGKGREDRNSREGLEKGEGEMIPLYTQPAKVRPYESCFGSDDSVYIPSNRFCRPTQTEFLNNLLCRQGLLRTSAFQRRTKNNGGW